MLSESELNIGGIKLPVFPLSQRNNRLVVPLVLRSCDAFDLHCLERGRIGLVFSRFEGRQMVAVECSTQTQTYSVALSTKDNLASYQGAEIRILDGIGNTLAVRRFLRPFDLMDEDEPVLHIKVPARDTMPFCLH